MRSAKQYHKEHHAAFREEVIAFLKDTGLTQIELADLMEIHKSNFNKTYSGKNNLSEAFHDKFKRATEEYKARLYPQEEQKLYQVKEPPAEYAKQNRQNTSNDAETIRILQEKVASLEKKVQEHSDIILKNNQLPGDGEKKAPDG